MEVIDYKMGGNSCPVIVADGLQKFFVKLRAGMSGEYSLLSEWFGNVIGKKLEINTRQPYWINLTNSLNYDNVYIEVRDLIEKSMGVNICFDYIETIRNCHSKETNALSKEKHINVYLLDVLLLNIDRTLVNPNLLFDSNDKLIVSDFESSLLFRQMLNTPKLLRDERILQCLRTNPFYQIIERGELDDFVKKLNEIDLELLFFQVPDEILSNRDKVKLLRIFESKKNNQWELRDLLESIDNTILETAEEREIRINENREKLERLIRSTHSKENCQ